MKIDREAYEKYKKAQLKKQKQMARNVSSPGPREFQVFAKAELIPQHNVFQSSSGVIHFSSRTRKRAKRAPLPIEDTSFDSGVDLEMSNLRKTWADSLPDLAKAYLRYISKLEDGRSEPRAIAPISRLHCLCQSFSKKNIYVYFVHHSQMFEVDLCTCRTWGEQLVEMGLLPASLNYIQFAVHFGTLEFMRDLRNVLKASGQGFANLYNRMNKACQKPMTRAFCQNVLPEYTRLMVIVDDLINQEVPLPVISR